MAKTKRKSTYPETVKAGIPRLDYLPEGWTRTTLKPYLVETKRPVKMDDNKPYDLVTVKRARGGVTKRETRLGRDISVKTQFEIQQNDFLISKRQIVHGACGVVPTHLNGSTVSNEYSVLCANDKLDTQFLKYLSHSQHFQRTCFHSSIGVHIEKMIFKLEQWFKWEFDMPPLSEQRRIAEILGTWDRAIAATEALITASEAQKKALMQQLLTGKRRLPGFDGAWKEVRLGDVCSITTGKRDANHGAEDGQYEFFTCSKETKKIDEYSFDTEAILIAGNGDVGHCKYYNGKFDAYQRTYVLDNFQQANIKFCFLVLQAFFEPQVQSLKQMGAMPYIKVGALKEFNFVIPSGKEQLAVISVLSSALRETQALQDKLQTLKTEKAALMQQLLTGKRRVNLTEAAW